VRRQVHVHFVVVVVQVIVVDVGVVVVAWSGVRVVAGPEAGGRCRRP
jgi:hypothetical protein